MSQKAPKPILSGQRLKTRKRDEKEKYDPSSFRDAIILGLNECSNDLEQVSKYLDTAGSRLDYRRYAEVLFDILFTGGQLAPGGLIVQDTDPTKPSRADICVFTAEENVETLKAFYEVFFKLIRRYKYLERSFEDELQKILIYLKAYSEEERCKLAIITGLFLANGLCSAKILSSLFEQHVVKEGLSLEFSTIMFRTWLNEKDINSVSAAMKRSQIENRLLELFPINKRSQEAFLNHFQEAGLGPVANLQRVQQSAEVKKELQKDLTRMINDNEPIKEIIAHLKEYMTKHKLSDHEMVVLVWNTVMGTVEWNKKEELVAEQALKHLRNYSLLFTAVAKTEKSELNLMVRIQEYCYDNINFMKVFQKIIILFYKSEVLSEDVVLKWYRDSPSSKGKGIFVSQMKKFVEWLKSAEEESD
ncbi:eIF5-mimic protein 2 [Octopus bimaculoides]|nr:eIF5-mimic protein 2 [Octopus bimaculoides]XP_014785884.1 eIF5-mimic protein 2 [Octopus bimaculoides]|eukprot:XP_014785883.1 PREDICTED: basic leucine zipper and W2 domain-containing protein 1-like [Octopus bimaculoides]